MLRYISLFVRYLQSFKERKKLLLTFADWHQQQQHLHNNKLSQKKLLLIIRLDDIGDYLLFRNSLHLYRQSPKWKGYTIHLLGNIAWKELFETYDAGTVDVCKWINKGSYYNDANYRADTWKRLRSSGYDTVICPTRMRPLLLDDLCMLAADAPVNIASPNTWRYPEWNMRSDAYYTSLFPSPALLHEFYFNEGFAIWCTGSSSSFLRPFINVSLSADAEKNYIFCFIGSNAKSRRWPAARWVEFIELIKKNYGCAVVIAYGRNEKILARQIENKTAVRSLDETVSLPELAKWIAASDVVISNNTMAVPLAVSCNKPVIIIANGDHFYTFNEYKKAGIENVITLYPKVFLRYWKKKNFKPFQNYIAVTNDIATIPAVTVFKAFKEIANQNNLYGTNTGN